MKAIIWTTLAAVTALTAAETSARAAGEPYLIGLIAGTTGAYGSTGVATVNGAQMAVDKSATSPWFSSLRCSIRISPRAKTST